MPPDAPPPDTSGLVEEQPIGGAIPESHVPAEGKVTLPLLSHLHSRLVHGSTLELSFHLAVRARVRLVAKRRSRVVAETPMRTLKAGSHKLLLRLDPRRWPTKLLTADPRPRAAAGRLLRHRRRGEHRHRQHEPARAGTAAEPPAGGIGTAALRRGRSRAAAGRARPTRLGLTLAFSGALVLVLALAGALPWHAGGPRAAAAPAQDALPQTDASIPARSVTMIGATPEEPGSPGSGESWGIGSEGGSTVVVRYASGAGWTLGPALPSGFKPEDSPLTGQMTPRGVGVLAGTVPDREGGPRDVLLVRGPGGAFAETGACRPKGKRSAKAKNRCCAKAKCSSAAVRARR